jgi:RimJ/RimL family protein N-acetyltransferase
MELDARETMGSARPELPPAPPASLDRYESDVVLKNGSTLHLRPIRRDDEPALLKFAGRLSRESLYLRFFSAGGFDLAKAQAVASIDYENQFALVAETREGIVALGQFYRIPRKPERAEVAFAVADALHGQGIGTSLLERLARIAREKGITTFEAEVLPDNRKMIEVFLHSGFEVKRKAEAGVVSFEISLARTAAAEEKAADRARHAATASLHAFFEP